MFFYKYSILILILSSFIFFMKYNENLYKMCRLSVKNEHFFNKFITEEKAIQDNFLNSRTQQINGQFHSKIQLNKKIEIVKNSCKDFYVDYESHTIMKYTIGYLINYIYNLESEDKKITENINLKNSNNYNELDPEGISFYFENLDLHNMKFNLYAIKFIHMFMYSSILYLLIISIPNVAAEFVMYLLNRLLFIFFIALFFEGISRFYLQLEIDLVKLFDKDYFGTQFLNFFPINYICEFLKLMVDLMNFRKYF